MPEKPKPRPKRPLRAHKVHAPAAERTVCICAEYKGYESRLFEFVQLLKIAWPQVALSYAK